jgi:hypothetical protein
MSFLLRKLKTCDNANNLHENWLLKITAGYFTRSKRVIFTTLKHQKLRKNNFYKLNIIIPSI